MNTGEWLAVVGGVLGALQVIVLFVLSDMRERIMRLESGQMAEARERASGNTWGD